MSPATLSYGGASIGGFGGISNGSSTSTSAGNNTGSNKTLGSKSRTRGKQSEEVDLFAVSFICVFYLLFCLV
jgi:hypothetical protein